VGTSGSRRPYRRGRSRYAKACHPLLSWSWAKVVSHSPLHATVRPTPSPRCCEEFNVNASLDSTFQSQFVFMRNELLHLVDARVEEAYRPLREKVATLKLLLARVGDSLESTDDEGTTPRVLAFGLPAAAQE
jgi:hypothetical protein